MCEKFDPCAAELIHEKEIELCQYLDAGGALETADVRFRIEYPTAKLHLTMLVFARPGANGVAAVSPGAHDYTGETWQLTAVADGNPPIECNAVFFDNNFPPVATPRPLPDTYEVDSGVKVIHGVAHVIGNADDSDADIMMLRCVWEPTDSHMTAAERQYWFAKCRVKRLGSSILPTIAIAT